MGYRSEVGIALLFPTVEERERFEKSLPDGHYEAMCKDGLKVSEDGRGLILSDPYVKWYSPGTVHGVDYGYAGVGRFESMMDASRDWDGVCCGAFARIGEEYEDIEYSVWWSDGSSDGSDPACEDMPAPWELLVLDVSRSIEINLKEKREEQ